MKKRQLLDIATFIGTLKLSELKDAESRHAMQDLHRALRKITKPIVEDIDDTRNEIFAGRQEEVNKYAELEAKQDKAGMDAMPEIKTMVADFRAATERILSEDAGELPKIDYHSQADAMADKEISFDEFEATFGELLKD